MLEYDGGITKETTSRTLVVRNIVNIKKEIEDYFAQFPVDIQNRLARIRSICLEEVPDADEAIKYRMPTIIWHGNLLHYAAFKNHIGIYPLPSVLVSLEKDLADYKTGKGSIQFDNDKPLPEVLIKKIVITRKTEKVEEMKKADQS